MVSEAKIKRDGKIIQTVVKKYCNEENAQFTFLANIAGTNYFSFSGDIRLLVDGISLLLGSMAASDERISESIFQYVATNAKKIYCKQKGIKEEDTNVEAVEGNDQAEPAGSNEKGNTEPKKPRSKRSQGSKQAAGSSGK